MKTYVDVARKIALYVGREIFLVGILLCPYFVLHNIAFTWDKVVVFYFLFTAVWVHVGFHKKENQRHHLKMPKVRETR